jgi:hypothetical protein
VGGRTLYGHALGVLMLDTRFRRPPGDVGNATTWPFPVRYRIVEGATSTRVVQEPDDALLGDFVDAALELEAEGVPAITTSCGFLAMFQQELSAALSVPFLSSSLLQVPLAARLIGPDRAVGIVTVSEDDLTDRHFRGVGWSRETVPTVVTGFASDSAFRMTHLGDGEEVDPAILRAEVVELGTQLKRDHPEVGAIVLECTNLVPYAHALRLALDLPVFDLYSLVMQTVEATRGTTFRPAR